REQLSLDEQELQKLQDLYERCENERKRLKHEQQQLLNEQKQLLLEKANIERSLNEAQLLLRKATENIEKQILILNQLKLELDTLQQEYNVQTEKLAEQNALVDKLKREQDECKL
ncbi:unnamed protein product, partial [Didymodactylos carnosus]